MVNGEDFIHARIRLKLSNKNQPSVRHYVD